MVTDRDQHLSAGPAGGTPAARLPANLPRRALLACLVAAPLSAAAGASSSPAGGLAFRILRGDREVGTHRISFTRSGAAGDERLVVATAIDIAVRFGPVTVFRLTHRASETWQGRAFERIESRTDDDGRADWMWAVRRDGSVLVDGSRSGAWRATADALPSTYWNPAQLAGPMLNAQDGRLLNARVTRGPVEDVRVEGGRVRARRYALSDDADLDIWYDLDGQWAHMQMRRAGALITYQRA